MSASAFDTLPHPEGWATDPSRFAIAAARRSQNMIDYYSGDLTIHAARLLRYYNEGSEVGFASVVHIIVFRLFLCLCLGTSLTERAR